MSDINKFIGIGRLTRDVELRFLPSQAAVAEFGLAMGRKFKSSGGEQREETCFLDCTIFGKGGEILAQYVGKGSQLGVTGRLALDQWDDKTTGAKRSKIKLIVEDFQFIGGKPGDGNRSGDSQGRQPERVKAKRAGGYGSQQSSEVDPPYTDEQEFKEDDIPF